MAYFNHAFQKAFIGTSAFNMNASSSNVAPYVSAAGATSSGTTITVGSTTNLTVGMQVTVTAGLGNFGVGTFVTAIVSATVFTVNVAPVVALSGGASVVSGFFSSMSQPTGGFTFVDPNTLQTPIIDNATIASHGLKCPLVLASGSVHGQWTAGKDKVGPFHGGYSESIKSKTINPKYVSNFYRVDSCPAQQAQVTVGLTTSTPIVLTSVSSSSTTITVSSTAGILPGMTIAVVSGTGTLATSVNANVVQAVTGTTTFTILTAPTVALSSATISVSSALTATCPQEYLCGETYSLRVDLKGSPALRFLTRNSYYTASAYTGCCPTGSLAPTAVNPLIVYVNWAYQLLNSPLIGPFIQVQVTYSTDLGVTFAALGDGTNSAANLALLQSYVLGNTALPSNTTSASLTQAGIIINGAYADTRFLDCTFYPNDSIIAFLEPIQVYASEVDLNGDPCTFSGVCVNNSCKAIQQKGTGENIIRSVIMTQAYSQDPFYNGQDLRIREITNGNDVYGTINRNSQYSRYYLQHSVPRFNNPTGTFDNEQYLLEIIAPATVSLTTSASVATGAQNLTASNIINFTTSGVVTGYVATITYFPPGSTTTATITGTVTVSAGNIAITVATAAIPAGSVITFQAAFTKNFEDFTNRWIANAQGASCVALNVHNCPVACAVIPANP
jgi:hypothetical protein